MPSAKVPEFSITPEGPMALVIATRELSKESTAESSGTSAETYTAATASAGVHPSTPDALHERHPFPNGSHSFSRVHSNATILNSPPPLLRIKTRQYMRRLKQGPFAFKLLVLLGAVGVVALLSNAVPGSSLAPHVGSIWSDFQDRFGYGLGVQEFCDPTQGDGFVNQENVWERADGACTSSLLLQRFRYTPKERYREEFPEFINKTVFVFGDSIGRHVFDDYCKFLTMDVEKRPFPGQEKEVLYWEGALCTEPTLNFKVIHFHSYGFANTSESNVESFEIVKKAFPGGPWDFETRISRLFSEALPELKPDFIQLNGGAWDFLWMYHRDIKYKQHNVVIPQADIQTFQQRLQELVLFVRDMFPQAKPLWINSHWMNPNDLNVRHTWARPFFYAAPLNQSEESPLLPPLFTPKRQTQHHHALYLAAEEIGIDMVDYWKIKDSFTPDQYFFALDRVHPIEAPRAVMTDMVLEKMHRWFAYGI